MKRSVLALLIALSTVAFLLTGCGAEQETTEYSAEKAREVLDDANRKMGELESLTVMGSYQLEARGTESAGLNFEFQVEMNVADPDNPEVHMSLTSTGEEADVYIKDGYTYSQVPEQGWIKTRVETSDEDTFSPVTPTDIVEFSENARNLRMVSEEHTHYLLAFDVGREFIEQQVKASLGQGGTVSGSEEILGELIENTEMSAVFRISRADKYIESAEFKMKMVNVPMVGEVNLDMKMEFSDFNEPVETSLPPEALDATEVVPAPKPPPTIPGVPGFER